MVRDFIFKLRKEKLDIKLRKNAQFCFSSVFRVLSKAYKIGLFRNLVLGN